MFSGRLLQGGGVKKTRILPVVVLLSMFFLGAGAFVFSDLLLVAPKPFAPRDLPAFYTGGFARGSGGQLEGSWDTFDSSNLFSPSQARNTQNALMPDGAFVSPQACGQCHQSVHDEWQLSAHAISATDTWYLKVKELFAVEQGEASVRLCAGCHAPVALMQGEVGLYNKESTSSQAGVSCGFCHTISAVHGGNGAYTFDPGRLRRHVFGDYLKNSNKSLGDLTSQWLVNTRPAWHQAEMQSELHSSGKGCQACHSFSINGVAIQNTWQEWQDSSFARQGVTCQGCHFTKNGIPNVAESGEVVSGVMKQSLYFHSLGGGSTVQAPRAEKNKLTIREAVKLEVRFQQGLEVIVKNVGAGHHIPTGVSDLRQMWLEVLAFDASNKVVFQSGVLDNQQAIPKDAVVFHQVLADKTGQPLTRHDIWRVKSILTDTRLAAGEARSSIFQIPANTQRVTVRLLWRDVPSQFAQQVLKTSASSIPITVLRSWEGSR